MHAPVRSHDLEGGETGPACLPRAGAPRKIPLRIPARYRKMMRFDARRRLRPPRGWGEYSARRVIACPASDEHGGVTVSR